jgi:hypothetical protein
MLSLAVELNDNVAAQIGIVLVSRSRAKIVPPVVILAAVYVVHFVLRPRAGRVKECEPTVVVVYNHGLQPFAWCSDRRQNGCEWNSQNLAACA